MEDISFYPMILRMLSKTPPDTLPCVEVELYPARRREGGSGTQVPSRERPYRFPPPLHYLTLSTPILT
ncbi:hypothetical protein J6590_022887 [Homalodisca vitripennis]|nr:hypothetical protein J6590_022887 [Homalodisca vitripennis]